MQVTPGEVDGVDDLLDRAREQHDAGPPPRKYVDVRRPYAGSPGVTAASARDAGTAS